MRHLSGMAVAAVLWTLCPAWVAAAAPEVTLVPKAPRVGEVVFITLRPDAELLRAGCSWRGKSYSFLPHGEALEVVLPVSLKTPAGAHHATIEWEYADARTGEIKLPVRVLARRLGVQRLRLSQEQEDTYSAPETQREQKLIGDALDRVSPERWWQESFAMPVEGRITTAFGLQRYINGRLAYRHRGVDIAAPEGTPVRAAADGVVSLADDSFLLHGQTIVVDHGHGVSTLYIHLSEISVRAGEGVTRGQVIGRVGATGVATGPHLHFGAYAYHEAVDPLFWMSLPES